MARCCTPPWGALRRGALLATLLASGCAGRAVAPGDAWKPLEPGLELGSFHPPGGTATDEPSIHVLRADESRFALKLLNASATSDGQPRSARQWADQATLVAAINAAMYQQDRRTSVSLMLSGGHVNNPRLSRDQSVLAFDPRDPSLPPVQIIDREHQDFETLRPRYRSLVQSIRMLSLAGENVWEQQRGRRWSTAAVGVDRHGRVLFIHSRSPYSVHDLIDMLLQLPLELRNAMYVEGGPEAQMYVRAGTDEREFLGSLDLGDGTTALTSPQAFPIPNVLGLVRRTAH